MIGTAKKRVTVEKIDVTVELRCDMCGALCPDPEDGVWGKDTYTTTRGPCITTNYYGNVEWDECDLCPDCVEWLLAEIHSGRLKRPQT